MPGGSGPVRRDRLPQAGEGVAGDPAVFADLHRQRVRGDEGERPGRVQRPVPELLHGLDEITAHAGNWDLDIESMPRFFTSRATGHLSRANSLLAIAVRCHRLALVRRGPLTVHTSAGDACTVGVDEHGAELTAPVRVLLRGEAFL